MKIPAKIIKRKAKLRGDDLYTGDSFRVTEVVPGDKCNNGGEYGFYSVFSQTPISGVYFWRRTTTCDFDECGTGPQGYVVLTKSIVERILKESKKITDAADEMWEEYHWGDGDYPRYTGDSCEAEIAAIIAENN